MKIQNLLTALAAAVIIVTVSACQPGSDSQSMKRAQLVGNENLNLKREIQKKDSEITSLKQQLEQTQNQRQTFQTQSEQLDTKSKQLEEENTRLKEELKNKELQIADMTKQITEMAEANVNSQNQQAIKDLMEMLAQCEEKLAKYESVKDSNSPAQKP